MNLVKIVYQKGRKRVKTGENRNNLGGVYESGREYALFCSLIPGKRGEKRPSAALELTESEKRAELRLFGDVSKNVSNLRPASIMAFPAPVL